jgi:hypothetical protein
MLLGNPLAFELFAPDGLTAEVAGVVTPLGAIDIFGEKKLNVFAKFAGTRFWCSHSYRLSMVFAAVLLVLVGVRWRLLRG